MGGGDLIRRGSGVVKDEYAASDADDQLAVCARICHRLLGAAHSGQALGLLAGDCVATRVQSDECALINGGIYVLLLRNVVLERSVFRLVAVVEKAHLSLQLPLAAELPHPSLRYAVLAGELGVVVAVELRFDVSVTDGAKDTLRLLEVDSRAADDRAQLVVISTVLASASHAFATASEITADVLL